MRRIVLALALVVAGCSHSSSNRPDGGGGTGGGGATSPIDMLPDTTSTIALYADQLDAGYSDALVRFVVAHFAGTQKLLKAENDRYRALSPNWFLLHYRLGSSSGPVDYIHNDTWSSDFADVTTHEDWFMHNQSGQRHHDATDNWDINDISNMGFRDYWVTSVISDMRACGAQGVFADSFEAGVSGYGVTDPDPRFDGTNPGNPSYWPNGDTWLMQKHEWSAYIVAAFANTPEHFLFVPNIGAMVTSWADIDYSNIDGAMLENFANNEAPSDWALGMNRALRLTSAGKFVIMQSYPDGTVANRDFLLATYLLLKGKHTFINLAGSGVTYFPEYALDFGAPSSALPADVSSYMFAGVYRRDFAKGIVLVNPSTSAVNVTLPGSYRLAQPSGGGAITDANFAANVDGSGNYIGGTVAFSTVTSVMMAPKSSALLLNP